MIHIIHRINAIGFLAIILSALMFSSCQKLIRIPNNPRNQLSADRVFSDSANIISAVAAVYSDFGVTSYSQSFLNGPITVFTGLAGDELIPGGDIYSAPAFYSNKILPDNQTVRTMWSAAYKSIFEINICLERIGTTSAISESLKRQLIGELKTTRAFCYFNMVNIWGGVPVITSTDYNVTQNKPRASTDSVYQFIVNDLVDAQGKLTADYPSAGRARPNLYTAQALLAKVYLYLGQYQNAINAANSVISPDVYHLTDLGAVFLSGSEEAIWQLPANGVYQATAEAYMMIPYSSAYMPNYVLSPVLMDAFEPDDQRKINWTNFSTVGTGPGSDYYYPWKYKNVQPTQTPTEDYMLLRLADVYLIRAEALAHEGNITGALTDLHAVRGRAGLDDVSTASQDDALKAIMHERQVEFFCEWGSRWFDLKRTKTIDEVLGAEKIAWKPTSALFPIPTPELQANPFLKQNPGY